MNRYIVSLLLILNSSLSLCFAQWEEHYQWRNCSFSGFYADNPFAGHSLGLFALEENTINKLSKASLLSDANISAVLSNDTYIYIGYSNGNIDIVDMSTGSTVNIPELKINEDIQTKSISSFLLQGNLLYCATKAGVFVVDLFKYEFKTHYKITKEGSPVNAIAVSKDSIYVTTNDGLYVADVNNRLLENQNNWHISHGITSACSDVTSFNSNVFVAVGTKGAQNVIRAIKADGSLSDFTTVAGFRHFFSTADRLCLVSKSFIKVCDTSLKVTNTVSAYKSDETSKGVNINSAALNGDLFVIADASLGMVTCDINGSNSVFTTLNGPSNNNSFKVYANATGVYVLGGGLTADFNNKGITPTIHVYDKGEWSTTTSTGRDVINICSDPVKPDSIYVSSWGSGIYKVENHKFVRNFNALNSSLVDIFGGNSYVRTNAITYDNNSNLIVANSGVTPGLWIKTPQNEWYPISYAPTNDLHSNVMMIHTRNDNTWFIISKMNNNCGPFVFNTNGTIDTDEDDLYRVKSAVANDSRCYGSLEIRDIDGEAIGSVVHAIVEDKSGTIWLGTDAGIVAFYDDATLFETPRPVFNRIKVPRNDGTNSADYLLDGVDVTAIAVDGANNKWVGTKTEGVFLINETGVQTLKHFNTKNSPLPTNEINSIAVHPTTGEVFISTPLGTLSYANYINEPSNALTDITAYPNPVRPEYDDIIRIKGFSHDCVVKITDITGKLVYQTKSQGGTALWNKETLSGLSLKSGVYLIWATDKDGNEAVVTKILLMK